MAATRFRFRFFFFSLFFYHFFLSFFRRFGLPATPVSRRRSRLSLERSFVMYKYYNAHPKGFWVDDCIDRAIAVATRMEYSEVKDGLCEQNRIDQERGLATSKDPRRFLEDSLGAKRFVFSNRGPWKMTAERFSKSYRNGRYILDMGWHFAACVNGVLLDTWDPSDETVRAAYLVTPVKDEQKITLRFCYTVSKVTDDETSVTFYDGNGRSTAKTLSKDDAENYIESLKRRGYPDMTDAREWL